jgi:peptidoglycan hydrolase CwlO-like protein
MEKHKLQKTALSVTKWVGSLQSVVVHTILFVGSFAAVFFNLITFDRMLLVLTTIVSLEAIYLSIFIQMTINIQQESLEEVEHDIDEIQEDIDEIQEDVDEIQEDVDEIQEDVEEITEKEKDEQH